MVEEVEAEVVVLVVVVLVLVLALRSASGRLEVMGLAQVLSTRPCPSEFTLQTFWGPCAGINFFQVVFIMFHQKP